MANDQQTQGEKKAMTSDASLQKQESASPQDAIDGLKDKKPEDLTPEELRLMADTMPGEGPGD